MRQRVFLQWVLFSGLLLCVHGCIGDTDAGTAMTDADIAAETAEMSRLQILQSSGVAVLVQARKINESLLGLLP